MTGLHLEHQRVVYFQLVMPASMQISKQNYDSKFMLIRNNRKARILNEIKQSFKQQLMICICMCVVTDSENIG